MLRKHKSGPWRLLPLALGVYLAVGSLTMRAAPADHHVPVIDVTDLYHPPQDPGDNFDLLAAYALPEVDLRAVILDCTETFRQPVANDPRPGLFADPHGPRDPGFIPVLQLNYLFGRAVPCAAGPFTPMRSPDDEMRDIPAFQQQGVELLLETLRRSPEPVQVASFGSLRPIAVALNRDPGLFHAKVARLLVCGGSASAETLEWNVALDPRAFVRFMRSDLPIALFPCATKGGAFVAACDNTYWKLSDLKFIRRMHPRLQAYLDFAFGRVQRSDFLRALDEGFPLDFNADIYGQPFNVWETAVWQEITGRTLVKRADGAYRLLTAAEVRGGGPDSTGGSAALLLGSQRRRQAGRETRIRNTTDLPEGRPTRGPARLAGGVADTLPEFRRSSEVGWPLQGNSILLTTPGCRRC